MDKMRRLLALALMSGLLLVACSGGDGSTTPTTAPEPTGTTSETETEAPLSDATIVVGANEIENWDPAATANAPIAGRWMDPVYDPLVQLEQDGTYSPALALSWEFVDDGSALQMTLREGVSFHDGTAFDAEAVKANIERNLAGDSVATQMGGITGATVVDEYTVNIDLEPGTGVTVLYGLSQTAGRMVSPAAFDQAATSPVGTGPFTFVSFETTRATFERNPDWWGEPPAYKTLVVQALGAGTTEWINAILAGDIDVGRLPAPSESELSQVQSAGDVVVETAPVGGFFDYVGFNRTRPPFDDPRVREAVLHAIDYEGVSAALGHAPTNQFAPPTAAYRADGVEDLYTYDVDRALELLEEAGYPDGFSVEMVTTTFGTLTPLSQIVQEALSAIGIEVEIRTFDGAAPITEYCFETQPDGCDMSVYTTSSREPLFLLTRMLFGDRDAHNLGGEPASGALAEAHAAASQARDEDDYQDALTEILGLMHRDEFTHVVVGMVPAYLMYREGIQGVTETMTVELYPQYERLVPPA